MTEKTPGALTRAKDRAGARWRALQDDHTWIRHVVAAYGLLQRNNGNQYAAAITYFSFLALFPLLLLAVSVTGFILQAHPAAEASLFDHLTQNIPGGLGTTLKESLQKAIQARTGVGIVGVLGVLVTGLGWIGNLRGAIDGVWGRPSARRSFLGGRIANLLVLFGLGVGLLVSLGLTVVGTSLTDQILGALGFDRVPGSAFVLKILGIAIAVGGDMIIFWWLLVRLPQAEVDRRLAVRGALMAAVGFEILKIVGTYTIAHTANSPTAGPFAGIIAVLVWIQLVARWMLFCTAWIATVNAAARTANQVPITPRPDVDADDVREPSAITPVAVGATLVGAGALAGAVATWAATRPRD